MKLFGFQRNINKILSFIERDFHTIVSILGEKSFYLFSIPYLSQHSSSSLSVTRYDNKSSCNGSRLTLCPNSIEKGCQAY